MTTLHASDAAILLRFQDAGRIAASDLLGSDLARANRLVKRGLLLRCHDDHWTLKLSSAGVSAIEAGGRQAKAGRILCLNPKCGRTVDAAKHGADAEVVCGKCWRLLPKALRDRYRDLGALDRKLERRRAAKPGGTIEVPLSAIGLRRRIETNWSEIRDFFLAPEKPEGLETFLAEMGWLEASPSYP